MHFYFSWLVDQSYSWICVLFSWVSKHGHGCHPENRQHTPDNNTLCNKYKMTRTFIAQVCLSLPVLRHPLSDHRLCVVFHQVPYVQVRGCIEYTKDCGPGLCPLQRDHRFTCCTVLPLCHWLLVTDCMQPDAAIPTTHLEKGQKERSLKKFVFLRLEYVLEQQDLLGGILCYFWTDSG